MIRNIWKIVSNLALAIFASLQPLLAQGPIDPPPRSTPGPTMKSLDQIYSQVGSVGEKRTPISSVPFTIYTPGSYYLTRNLTYTGTDTAIQVSEDLIGPQYVTIDLNGFTLTGPGIANGYAINSGASAGLTVKNGTITNFLYGILNAGALLAYDLHVDSCDYGISSSNGPNIIRNCHVVTSKHVAVDAGAYALVEDCSVLLSDQVGIYVLNDAVVANCTVFNAGTAIQIDGRSSIVRNCTVNIAQVSGIVATDDVIVEHCNVSDSVGDGIQAGVRCKIIDSIANRNGSGANGNGIVTGIRAEVLRCHADENQKNGIVVSGDSVVTDNHASNNGRGGAAAGIDSSGGGGSRIEANHTRDNNGIGIKASSKDVVIRNTAGSNTTDFSPSSGTNFAPVQTPSAATNPFANIAF